MSYNPLLYEQELFILDICIMFLSMAGNVVVIYFICGSKRARTTHNVTIVSISISNIVTSGFVMPTYLAMMRRDKSFDNMAPYMCKLNKYVWYWCKTVNIYSVVAMMCDRYFKVMNPCKHGYVTGRCLFFLNFIWFFGAAYNIWEIITNTSYRFLINSDNRNVSVRKCLMSLHFSNIKNGFLITDYILLYMFPLILLSYLSVCIYIKLCTESEQRTSGNYRFIMSILLAVLCYVCQLPLEIMQTMLYMTDNLTSHTLSLLQLLESLAFSHGMFHAVIYACCGQEVALAFNVQRVRQRITRDPCGHVGPQILLTSVSHENVTDHEPVIETLEA